MIVEYPVDLNRKDVRLPVQLQRAMAAEAEAAREARAKVIAADGEQKVIMVPDATYDILYYTQASLALKLAADVMMDSPHALQVVAG